MNSEEKRVIVRLLTGINGKDTFGCEWYEGILEDAKSEAEQIIHNGG